MVNYPLANYLHLPSAILGDNQCAWPSQLQQTCEADSAETTLGFVKASITASPAVTQLDSDSLDVSNSNDLTGLPSNASSLQHQLHAKLNTTKTITCWRYGPQGITAPFTTMAWHTQ